MGAVNTMAEYYQMPVVYSLHPRSAKWIEKRKWRKFQNDYKAIFTGKNAVDTVEKKHKKRSGK